VSYQCVLCANDRRKETEHPDAEGRPIPKGEYLIVGTAVCYNHIGAVMASLALIAEGFNS
jgi:hypothetical protein